MQSPDQYPVTPADQSSCNDTSTKINKSPHPGDPSAPSTEQAAFEPLAFSGDVPGDNIVYPTGAKFAFVSMALGLSLVLVGLVGV